MKRTELDKEMKITDREQETEMSVMLAFPWFGSLSFSNPPSRPLIFMAWR